MEDNFQSLDQRARLALDVAIGTAGASGDPQCGTEHLLFGLIATADKEMGELSDLFALNTLRIERGLRELAPASAVGPLTGSRPGLSTRAQRALTNPHRDGDSLVAPFDVLYEILGDEGSGASQVLRALGVRIDEVRRLAGYGMRRLSPEQIESVITSLNRRSDANHRPWWGPSAEEQLTTMAPTPDGPLELARSRTTIVTLRTVAGGQDGFGFTLCLESTEPWLLDPVLVPGELLVPGQGSKALLGPDLVRVELTFADGSVVDNRAPVARYERERPFGGRLVLLGHRREVTKLNDRRHPLRQLVIADWWVHPRPAAGTIQFRVDWPAESVSGLGSFDARALVEVH